MSKESGSVGILIRAAGLLLLGATVSVGAGAQTAAREAEPATPSPVNASNSKPLTSVQVKGLVAGGVSSTRLAALVAERGIGFQPTPNYLEDLRSAGATETLISALSASRRDAEAGDANRGTAERPFVSSARFASNARFLKAKPPFGPPEQVRPEDPSGHLALANALSEEGKWNEAALQYAAVISSKPDDAIVHNNLALALKRTGDLNGAIREYRRSLAIDPSLAAVHDNLGVALREKGETEGALGEFREAVRQNPRSPQAHDNLGTMLEQQRDLNGAIREYRQALTLEPGCCDAQYNLGTALELGGDLDGAEAAFRKALDLKPADARGHVGLASALERKGDSAGALEQYRIALRLAPSDASIRSSRDRLARRASPPAGYSGGSGR